MIDIMMFSDPICNMKTGGDVKDSNLTHTSVGNFYSLKNMIYYDENESMLFHCKYAYVMQIRISEVAYGGMREP